MLYAVDWRHMARQISSGTKYDSEKIRMDLLPFEALEAVADVLTHGARKYTDNGWQTVENAERRYLAALLRHLAARERGEARDAESGLLHAAHVATNALFILWFELQKGKENGVAK
jgi:hypothetical protein